MICKNHVLIVLCSHTMVPYRMHAFITVLQVWWVHSLYIMSKHWLYTLHNLYKLHVLGLNYDIINIETKSFEVQFEVIVWKQQSRLFYFCNDICMFSSHVDYIEHLPVNILLQYFKLTTLSRFFMKQS